MWQLVYDSLDVLDTIFSVIFHSDLSVSFGSAIVISFAPSAVSNLTANDDDLFSSDMRKPLISSWSLLSVYSEAAELILAPCAYVTG